jgi:IS5 family transposase
MHVTQIYGDLLQKYVDDIDDLLALLGGMRSPADKADAAKARAMLKALKQRLDYDYREGQTEKSRSRLSEIDLRYYRPAVEGAHSHLKLKASSALDQRWIDALTAARDEMSLYRELLGKGF